MNDNNQNKQNPQGGLQIELPQDKSAGVYSNLAMIAHSPTEFIVDFASMLAGMPKAVVRSRIILAPEHAKRLLAALQENIMKYEKEFGKIEIRNQQPRTIAPFGNPKGEA
ncbi:MAG: DUF3467 domain-containing protein [Prevotella sp.]|nr:DUF3467 domain-containing protein [Prevotella sp.]